MGRRKGCILVFCFVLYLCIIATLFTHCDARVTKRHLKASRSSTSIIKSIMKLKDVKHLDIPMLDPPLNTEPYVSSPFSMLPFNALSPISSPQTNPSSADCNDPPSNTPLPPSTVIPSPIIHTYPPPPPPPLESSLPPLSPILPIESPPPPPSPSANSLPPLSPIFPIENPPPSPTLVNPSPPESPPIDFPEPPESSPSHPGDTPSPPQYGQTPSVNFPSPSVNIPSPSGVTPSPSISFPSPSGNIPSPSGVIPSPSVSFPSPSGFLPSPPVFQPPVVYPPPTVNPSPPKGTGLALWCVAKPSVPDPIVEEAMNYACGSGADCGSIQPAGSCYEPDTLFAHSSYAFNSYWQRTKAAGGTCDFGGTAMLVTIDPSFNQCLFVIY